MKIPPATSSRSSDAACPLRRRGRTGRSPKAAQRGLAQPIPSERDALDELESLGDATLCVRAWCRTCRSAHCSRAASTRRRSWRSCRKPAGGRSGRYTIGLDDEVFRRSGMPRASRAPRHATTRSSPISGTDAQRADPTDGGHLRRAVRLILRSCRRSSSRSSRASTSPSRSAATAATSCSAATTGLRLRRAHAASRRSASGGRAAVGCGWCRDRLTADSLDRLGGRIGERVEKMGALDGGAARSATCTSRCSPRLAAARIDRPRRRSDR